jgi:hypothetical protein|tara:strand:+ start:2592 stop:2762 length:171 start_codon:yes stop_codon:yes gene_type:complete
MKLDVLKEMVQENIDRDKADLKEAKRENETRELKRLFQIRIRVRKGFMEQLNELTK